LPPDVIPAAYLPGELSPLKKFFLAAHPHAWRRFWARFVDLGTSRILLEIMALALCSATGWVPPYASHPVPSYLVSFVVWVSFLIFSEAVSLASTGTTVGKWLFGIRVTHKDGSRFSFRQALSRSFGQGLRIE
jgi:uncharacterized RDD family membrane protein YckC